MKLDHAISLVEDAESDLAGDLRRIGERHAADADVYHVARLLASRCDRHLERLAPLAERYRVPRREADGESSGWTERLRRMTSEILGRTSLSGMMLLEDLQELYLVAHRAELAWTILVQAAKAARDAELLAAAQDGREEAERCWKWVRTRIKEASPQVLVVG